MKVKVKGNPIVSGLGSLSDGVIYPNLPDHIAMHLVDIGSAEILGTKALDSRLEISQKKSEVTVSSLLPAAQASQKKMSKKRETLTLSQSTRITK